MNLIYREKRIYAGKILEVEVYPITIQDKKKKRRDKEKESLQKQKNLNDKNARKHLIRLINANFTNKDLAVHLTYSDKNLPKNDKEAKRDVANYMRRLKHYRKKNNLEPLKYIAVIEYKNQESGKRVRLHHHIIINDMDRDVVEELWGKGWVNADRLQENEYGYEALGRYISKDPKGNKRWTQSKNLKKPIIKVNDSKYKRKKVYDIAKNPDDTREFEKLYPGYFLNECKVEFNEINGETYLYIKMRKIRPQKVGKENEV